MSSNTIYTTTGYAFRQLEPSEVRDLEVGEEVCIGVYSEKEDGKRQLELIPSVVTKTAYYNSDCDEPGWEIETNNGVTDLYSLYTKPERY